MEVRAPRVIIPGVAVPQAGEDLSHGAEVLLHLAFFDGLSFLGKISSSHMMCKNW